ncbi:hypothetical protein [Desulfitobacterium metallireducens]|uniref:Membrane-spanning protein n=1 Tax=Desulfitobacterium metallireducens DSM 15288 TaxID=871968 RepID=W0E8E8_9FIRM|nr:hypothetical protein [Desulfitobacterium metallireducens]AHF07042.1 hypothetical protein DESME_08150 [Desulfitobacterium metallireducens DSM 15288]
MKRVILGLYSLLSVTIIVNGFGEISQNVWGSFGMSMLTLIFMTLPFLIEKRFKLEFPREFLSVLLLFFYASMFLGTANHFYTRFWWWDKMLHGFSGLIFANLGFLIAMFLQNREKIGSALNRILVALFAFCFSVAAGAVWEIYEYTMDEIFGFLYQGVGIHDTMTDIIADALGALIFALFLFFQGQGKIKMISEGEEKTTHDYGQ